MAKSGIPTPVTLKHGIHVRSREGLRLTRGGQAGKKKLGDGRDSSAPAHAHPGSPV
jgi:hypothetical protein